MRFLEGTEGIWILQDFQDADTFCEFSSLGCPIKLADVYRDVPLELALTRQELIEK